MALYVASLSVDNQNIDDLQASTAIQPNPSTNIVNIDFTNNSVLKSVHVIDLLGGVHLMSIKNNTLDISHLQSGMYFIKITLDSGIITKKIIKN